MYVYLCLPMYTRVYLCLPQFTSVCLPMYMDIYLRFPIFTLLYLCYPFAHVNPVFTCVYVSVFVIT